MKAEWKADELVASLAGRWASPSVDGSAVMMAGALAETMAVWWVMSLDPSMVVMTVALLAVATVASMVVHLAGPTVSSKAVTSVVDWAETTVAALVAM